MLLISSVSQTSSLGVGYPPQRGFLPSAGRGTCSSPPRSTKRSHRASATRAPPTAAPPAPRGPRGACILPGRRVPAPPQAPSPYRRLPSRGPWSLHAACASSYRVSGGTAESPAEVRGWVPAARHCRLRLLPGATQGPPRSPQPPGLARPPSAAAPAPRAAGGPAGPWKLRTVPHCRGRT